MSDRRDWYLVENIDEIDSPALLFYPERVERNIRLMIRTAGSASKLRPHIKTHKTAEIVRMQQAHDIDKFKCATISEAEMLGSVGASEVLLAYQPTGPKIVRIVELVRKFPQTKFATIVDNPRSADEIAAGFAQAGLSIDLLIDFNVGMNRTGIRPGPSAIELMRKVNDAQGINLAGFHVYDGHVRDKSIEPRKRACDEAVKPVIELGATFRELRHTDPLLVAGGSASFPIHARREGVECSPGTSLLWDWGYSESFPDMSFEIAAALVTRVISVIDEETVCLDLGHKAVAAEKPFPRAHFLNAPGAEMISQSEEHLVVRVAGGHSFRVGEVLYGIPTHICPTVALYQEANVVESHTVSDTWKIVARDRRITL